MAAPSVPGVDRVGASEFLARRATEALGLCLLAAAVLIAVALWGYDAERPVAQPRDRRCQHQPARPFRRQLRRRAAADHGARAWLLVLILPLWAPSPDLRQPLAWPWLPIAALPLALLAGAAWLATRPLPESWPFWVGLGGFMGDFMLHRLERPVGPEIYPLVTGSLALLLTILAFGLSLRELWHGGRALATGSWRGGRPQPASAPPGEPRWAQAIDDRYGEPPPERPRRRRPLGAALALLGGLGRRARPQPAQPPRAAGRHPGGRHQAHDRPGDRGDRAPPAAGGERARRRPGARRRRGAQSRGAGRRGQASARRAGGARGGGRVQAAAARFPLGPPAPRRHQPRSCGAERDRARAREGAGRLRRARRDRRRAAGPGGHALRARAGARHAGGARGRAGRRHRPLALRDVGARRHGAGPQRDRHRAAQRPARDGLPARPAREPGLRGYLGRPDARARQGHQRRPGGRRSRPHAASADRRHHGLGQVGRDQRDDPLAALPAAARPVQDHHDRPQGDRALGLRGHPAPLGAGRDRAAQGGRRAQVGGARDGRALPADVAPRRARHLRLQPPDQRGAGPRRAALAPRADRLRARDRRAGVRAAADRDDADAADRRGGRRGRRPDADRGQGDRIRRSSACRRRRAPPAST